MAELILKRNAYFKGTGGKLLRILNAEPISVKYGLLYNYYVAVDSRNIANEGWHVSTAIEWVALGVYVGGTENSTYWLDTPNSCGGYYKQTGTTFWDSPNTGASNSYGLNIRGAGIRANNFGLLNQGSGLFGYKDSTSYNGFSFSYNQADLVSVGYAGESLRNGFSMRLVKDSTSLSNGQTGTYISNDNRTYSTICINGKEWLANNLAETKYRNGDTIPEVTDQTTWNGLTSGALCSYNNDWSNVELV